MMAKITDLYILKQFGKDAIKRDFIKAISYENFYNQTGIGVDKKSQELSQPTQISDKKITRFVKEIQRESLQNNNANLNAYKEFNITNKQNEISKPVVPTRNIEREI